ncbi:uncharacterized protein LOC111714541 [Eurytemora carolleeae]|uniref:uncharacterized protein LOC111714541 n=1 Tax=Eurytemora carolleeae TaxID=1294199 RepID=UPI000C7567AB|nr:uncharacterized protein LOC111714541 [Eurytemora carolleeae]|eukprot:XP_023345444.1 uncharacterized protein LOC111714541 [Eurytemora affinis]
MACASFNATEKSTTEEIQKLSKETKAKIEKYLEGENSEKKKMECKFPLFFFMTNTTPEYTLTMCHNITETTTPPEPLPGKGYSKTPDVFLKSCGKGEYYVRKFSGPGGDNQDKTWHEEVKKLQEEIDGEGLKYDNTIIYGMTNNTREETKDRQDSVMLKKADDSGKADETTTTAATTTTTASTTTTAAETTTKKEEPKGYSADKEEPKGYSADKEEEKKGYSDK